MSRVLEFRTQASGGDVEFVQSGAGEPFPHATLSEAEAAGWDVITFLDTLGQHGFPLVALRQVRKDFHWPAKEPDVTTEQTGS